MYFYIIRSSAQQLTNLICIIRLNGCVINGFCKSNPERTEVAIKNITLDIDKERVNEFIINGTLIEIFATTKAANHPNIIRTQMVFFKDNRLTLILELMHGSVKNLMDKAIYTNTKFSVGQVVYIALEVKTYFPL
jgi:sporulation protein YlmC with PRC-barrel domain